MPGTRVHHTKTTDSDWDGPGAEARIPDEADSKKLKQVYAWYESRGDARKGAHKFPHHEVTKRGKSQAANVKACISGIGILNGGRGGADIPKSERRQVYNHLAAHLRDAGKEPAPLKD